jgi:hypothetical protein
MMNPRLLIAIATVTAFGCSDGGELTQPTSEPDITSPSFVVSPPGRGAGNARTKSYEVTIENLTGGQPLTPPVIATHRRATRIFKVGRAASFELKEIAENGNVTPLVDALSDSRHVASVVVAVAGSPPPVLPGGSVTVSITSTRGTEFFSLASMLICTNDGFTGVDSRRLPPRVGQTVVLESDGYDAGTEVNTQDFADIVPPCPPLTGVSSSDPGTGASDPLLAEGDVIRHHPGILSGDDLMPGLHGWTDPVAKITITRTG